MTLHPARNLATVFSDPQFADRRVDGSTPTPATTRSTSAKVPNLKQRQAIAAALDRAQLRTIAGGEFAGDLADGASSRTCRPPTRPRACGPACSVSRSRTTGDPEYAKQLITAVRCSRCRRSQFDYPQTPTNDKAAAAVVSSLGKAGIKVKPNPIEAGQFYGIVFDPDKAGDLIAAGWGPDWPNALDRHPAAVHPERWLRPLAGRRQGLQRKVSSAAEDTDLAAQRRRSGRTSTRRPWRKSGSSRPASACSSAWPAPGQGGLRQGRPVYLWAPYGSWPYGDMYVIGS